MPSRITWRSNILIALRWPVRFAIIASSARRNIRRGSCAQRGSASPWIHDLVELKSLLNVRWDDAVATGEELEKLTVFEVVGRYWEDGSRLLPSDAEMACAVVEPIRGFARTQLNLSVSDVKTNTNTNGGSGADQT